MATAESFRRIKSARIAFVWLAGSFLVLFCKLTYACPIQVQTGAQLDELARNSSMDCNILQLVAPNYDLTGSLWIIEGRRLNIIGVSNSASRISLLERGLAVVNGGSLSISHVSIIGVSSEALTESTISVGASSSLELNDVIVSTFNASTPYAESLIEGCIKVNGSGASVNLTSTIIEACNSNKNGAAIGVASASGPIGVILTLTNVEIRNNRSPTGTGIYIGRNSAPINITTSGIIKFFNNSAKASSSGFWADGNYDKVNVFGTASTWICSQQSSATGNCIYLLPAVFFPQSIVVLEIGSLVVNESASSPNSLIRSGSALAISIADGSVQAIFGSITVSGNQRPQPGGENSVIQIRRSVPFGLTDMAHDSKKTTDGIVSNSKSPVIPPESFVKVLNDIVIVNSGSTPIQTATAVGLEQDLVLHVLGDIILRDNDATNFLGDNGVTTGGISCSISGGRTIIRASSLEVSGGTAAVGGALYVYNHVRPNSLKSMQLILEKSLRLTNNKAIGFHDTITNNPFAYGGAIYVDALSYLNISSPVVVIENNTAEYGGGIAQSSSGSVNFVSSSVSLRSNFASLAGGAFYGFDYPNSTSALQNFTLPTVLQQVTSVFTNNKANQGCIASFDALEIDPEVPLCNQSALQQPLHSSFANNFWTNASQPSPCEVVDIHCNVSKTVPCPSAPVGGDPTLWTCTDSGIWVYSGDLIVQDLSIQSPVVITHDLVIKGSISWITRNGVIPFITVGACAATIPTGFISVANQSELTPLMSLAPVSILTSTTCKTKLLDLRPAPVSFSNNFVFNWVISSYGDGSIVFVSDFRNHGVDIRDWILFGVLSGMIVLSAIGLVIFIVKRRLARSSDPQKQPLIINREDKSA